MSDGITSMFDDIQEKRDKAYLDCLGKKPPDVVLKNLLDSISRIQRVLQDDPPMTRYHRNCLDYSLKNLQDLLK